MLTRRYEGKMNKVVIGLLLMSIAVFSGCASTHMVEHKVAPELTDKSDVATVVIIRNTSWGSMAVFSYYLDKELVGETWGNTYFTTNVTPGQHSLLTVSVNKSNKTVAQFDFKAGKTYFLVQELGYSGWTGYLSAGFAPLPSYNEAKTAIQDCTYLHYDTAKKGEDLDDAQYQQAIDEYLKDVEANPASYEEILKYDGILLN